MLLSPFTDYQIETFYSYFLTTAYVMGTQKIVSFHPQHLLKLLGKKIITILR